MYERHKRRKVVLGESSKITDVEASAQLRNLNGFRMYARKSCNSD